MTYYQTSIANIKSLAAGIGQEITRQQAIAALSGDAKKSDKLRTIRETIA